MKFSGRFTLLFCLLILSSRFAVAQKQANVWYFGNLAGLQFAGNGNPNILTNGKMKALEGCSAISDSLGSLLFYTAGDTVYNKFHQKMNNGWLLSGHRSASQAAVIAEDPFNIGYYYIFTTEELGNNTNGLRYSIVNVKANNGYGSVIAKNIPLLSPVAEKVTIVDDRYSRGWWVIAHGTATANDAFYAYRLSPTGLSAPVISRVGQSQAGGYPNFNAIGYMKASPDGQSLAVALSDKNEVELYAFNDSSGVISDPVLLENLPKAYGVEFNRNGSRLYVSTQLNSVEVVQFNLDIKDRSKIPATRVSIGLGRAAFAGALQLAPNNRIYLADVFGARLSFIANPDSLRGLAGFIPENQYLNVAGQTTRFSQQGLPNFNQSYFWLPSFKFRKRCFGDTMAFTLLTTRKFRSLSWNFDDVSSGAENTSWLSNPTHIFTGPGTYNVTLTITLHNNKVRSLTIPVIIDAAPALELGPDQQICPNGKLKLTSPLVYKKYLWSTGSDSAGTVISKPGKYWLKVWNATGCWNIDTVNVILKPGPEIFSQKKIEVCPGRSARLHTKLPFTSYDWGRGRTDSAITVNRAGWYPVKVPYNGCVFTDSVEVVYKDCPEDLMIPNIITLNGDGLNENLFVRGFRPGQFEVKIFNRWGNLIFEEKSYQFDWPKTNQPDGTYYYMLFNPTTRQTFKGWVEVVH